MVFCQKCGTKNQDEALFCEKCGNKLDSTNNKPISESSNYKPVYESSEKPVSGILIVVGYIFSILGGLIGIVIGLYLVTRKNSKAQFHGRIMLLIALVVIILSTAISYRLSTFI